MTNPDNKITERYKKELLSRKTHDFNLQLNLKRRVRDTYAQLLSMFTGESLNGGDFLDTGSSNSAFEAACEEISLSCKSLDIDMGVNFEHDPFPYKDQSFRFINSNSVIEHLRNPSNYLSEIHRVLQDDGYLFLVTPHWPYCWKSFYDSYTHYQPYSYTSMRDVLSAHGFEAIALIPWLVKKSRFFWRLPPPLSFWVAKNLLLFPGTVKYLPGFLKGHSTTLLVLARKSPE